MQFSANKSLHLRNGARYDQGYYDRLIGIAVSWLSMNDNKSSSVNCSLTSLDGTTVPNIVTNHLSSSWYDGNSKPIKNLIKMQL